MFITCIVTTDSQSTGTEFAPQRVQSIFLLLTECYHDSIGVECFHCVWKDGKIFLRRVRLKTAVAFSVTFHING